VRRSAGKTLIERRTTGSVIGSPDIRELELLIPPEDYARMEPGVEYTLVPRNEVSGYHWKTRGRVTIAKKRGAGS
jgi:hypothetical protein